MTTTRVTMVRLLVVLPLIGAACGDSSPSPPPPTELRSDKVRVTAPPSAPTTPPRSPPATSRSRSTCTSQLRATQPGNFIFSQTSISTALAMLYAGAGTTTATEMATALHFGLPADRLHPAFNALDLALTTPPAGSERRRVPARGRQLDLGPGRLRRAAELPRHAGRELRRRPVRRGLRDEPGGRARPDQRLGLRPHGGADPGAVPEGVDQHADAAGAGQRRLLPRRLEDAVQARRDRDRAVPRADRRRQRPDHARRAQRRALERHRLERRRARLRRRHDVDDRGRPRRGNVRRLRGGPDRRRPRARSWRARSRAAARI